MTNKYFANYLDKNPDIARKISMFSGKQTAKQLKSTIVHEQNFKDMDMAHGNEEALHALNPNATYDDSVGQGDVYGSVVPSLNKKQIKSYLKLSNGFAPMDKYKVERRSPYEALKHTIAKPIEPKMKVGYKFSNKKKVVFKPHQSTDEKEYKNKTKFGRRQSNELIKSQILAAKRNHGRQR